MRLVSESRKNKTVIFPVVGEITFDEDGVLEVSDKDGDEILNKWKVTGVHLEGEKTEAQTKQEQKKEDTQSQIDNAVKNIRGMKSYDDLHQLCKDANIPDGEWKGLKVPELKKLLIGKIAPEVAKADAEAAEAKAAADEAAKAAAAKAIEDAAAEEAAKADEAQDTEDSGSETPESEPEQETEEPETEKPAE